MKKKIVLPAILLLLILLAVRSGERSNRSPTLMLLST